MFHLLRYNVTTLFGIFILLMTTWMTISQDVNQTMEIPKRSLRLPNTSYPLRYHLHVITNIHRKILDYSANVTIDILIKESTNEIVLHSKKLDDFVIKVTESATGDVLDNIVYTYDAACSFLIIHPRENFQAFEAGQEYRVEILFSAVMNVRTIGIYWLTYTDRNNETVLLAATQFEPTSARNAFPCYDEPAFKSNFTISITHGSNYSAISNMQVNGDPVQGEDNMTTTTFHETPPMSTYLVAFVVSNYEYISEEYNGVTQRVFTVPDTQDKGQKALQNAVRTVAALEEYLGIKYSLDKLDHIALSKNYGAAMENWGLITYRDESLINNDEADMHRKLKDLLTQNHEISHQWFGNLVSPEWWTYAWMNEGFATYFGYLITDMVYPEYKVMELFLTDVAERAYSCITVRPMTFYVEKEKEILGVFDYISYQRAACIIKMFHHAFNEQTFISGINRFLNKYQYTATSEDNLFETLQEVVSEDNSIGKRSWNGSVHDIMSSWTHSEWIPIVMITINYEQNTITIRQRCKDASYSELWWIPLNFATASQPEFTATHADYFMPPVPEITLPADDVGLSLQPKEWLIANRQQTGFYHVLYDDVNLMAIAKQLQTNHTAIHPLNRAAIFQDLCPLIENNEINSVGVIFELLKYLRYEENFIPWNNVADVVGFIDKNLYNTPIHELYKEFIRELITPIYHKLQKVSRTNETNTAILARQKVIEMACAVDLPECLEFARNLAFDYIFRKIQIHPDMDYYAMHDSILCMGLKYLSDKDFNAILKLLNESERSSMWYDDLIYSLRCTQSRTHLRQYLNMLIGENSTHIMNENESMMYLFYVYKSNLAARSVVWSFFEKNYKILCRSPYFNENFNRMAEYVPQAFREQFITLHDMIASEMKESNLRSDKDNLIDGSSHRIGLKVKYHELFLTKFEHDIDDWLKRELGPIVNAASIGVRSQANSVVSPLSSTMKLIRNLLPTM